MIRNDPPWLSPPAIVQPHVRPVRRVSEAEMQAAIEAAVRETIALLGIEALKATSMFPNSSRRILAEREARARAAREQSDTE